MNQRFQRPVCRVGLFALAVLVTVTAWPLAAQEKKADSGTAARYVYAPSLASPLRKVVNAYGNRFQRPGMERIVYTATIKQEGMTQNAQVILEYPGKARIEIQDGKTAPIIINGDSTASKGSSTDSEALVELAGSDSIEYFLGNVQNPAVRVMRIGEGFVVKGVTGFGGIVDIYRILEHSDGTKENPASRKMYLFDSQTGLLSRVIERSGESGTIIVKQTEYSGYKGINGIPYPQRIKRIINGQTTLELDPITATVQEKRNDGIFGSEVNQ